MQTTPASTRITDIRTVAIPVSDTDRAIDFYTGSLGFEVRMDAPFGDGRRWVEVAAPDASTSIALVPPGPGKRAGIDTGIRLATADADADHDELERRGVDVDSEILRSPVPMFTFRDQDGNTLYIVQSQQ
jgi:catechol 2,3-dioxygenase-like lactoylglutathione lyase family enzyme